MHHLKNTFNVFTESGSLTPLQMLALFQFFQKSPYYDKSSIHQQCKEFNKKSATSTQEPVNDDDEIG